MIVIARRAMRRTRATSVALTALALIASLGAFAPAVSAAATITVTTTLAGVNEDAECSLQEAIYAANLDAAKAPDPANLADLEAYITTGCAAGSGDDTILLPAAAVFTMQGPVADVLNYLGPTATPMVSSTITIEGVGARIQHGGGTVPYRAFAVGEGGDLTLHEVHVKGFEVHGGNGADGGGGGMGAGGAVFVHGGTLGIGWSTFEQNGALGGDGADGNFGAGGGGGGIGGDGGAGLGGGGGGGGARGDGASGEDYGCGVLCIGGAPGGGGGGTYADATGVAGAFRCGGDGSDGVADVFIPFSRDGETGTCAGGGGGGGQEALPLGVIGGFYGGDGGWGNYGGGGGGGAYLLLAGDGGHGGFGGGGGGTNTSSGNETGFGPNGGDAGFGGGGGAGAGGLLDVGSGGGAGGTFAGDGSEHAGGGGAGLGGAIFGDQASISILNSTFVNNYANRGHSGGEDANDGRGAGGAIFALASSVRINSSTFSNNQTGEYTTGVGGLGGGAIVVYKPTTDEATSLVLRNSILAGNGPHECYVRNGATANGVGNLITDNSTNGHDDPGCPGVETTLDPALAGLAVTEPGRTPTMAISLGSSAHDVADPTTSALDDQRGVLRPQGAGPDIGAFEVTDGPPVTTITLAPATPDGTNDWYQSSVGVTIAATDPDNNLAQTRCALDPASVPAVFADLPDAPCAIASVAADGEHAIYAASIDTSGNTEDPVVSVSFRKDGTDPDLAPTLSVPSVVVGQTGVTASPNATDATSGVATSSCGAVDASTPGARSVTCTATDNAGNTATATLDYVVEYRILGFFSPVPMSKWKVGQTVPVKVALGDLDGTRIPDAEATALARSCQVTFSATGAQTKTDQCLKYDARADQFIYNWKLAKAGAGMVTITLSVSYPGSSTTTTLTEQISIIP